MTPTARWAAAQRRKRQVINQAVIHRAMQDQRRTGTAETVPATAK
ncbi:hypothetical protein [Actinomadura kijaniata]|nr:hypothetical protein [Actinomadura kijaniata]